MSVCVVGADVHACLEGRRGLVEITFGQVDPADRLVEMVLADQRVPFRRLLEGTRRVEVPGHQLIQAAQAVVSLTGGRHRGDRGQQRPLRVGVPSGRAVDVGQRHTGPFVGRIQADGCRERRQAVVRLVRLPQRNPEESVRLGACRLGGDDRLQVLDRERHVPGAEGGAAIDQRVAARGDAAQRVAIEGLPEEVECVGVGPSGEAREGLRVKGGREDRRHAGGLPQQGHALEGRAAVVLRRRIGQPRLLGRHKGLQGLGRLAVLSGQGELPGLAVEQSRPARVDCRGLRERRGGRGRLVRQGLHECLIGVRIGPPHVQPPGLRELALRRVEPVAIEIHDAEREVDLGGPVARAHALLELLDRAVPRREHGAHRLERGPDPRPLVAEGAGQREDELADGSDELLFLPADLRNRGEGVLDGQFTGGTLALGGGLGGPDGLRRGGAEARGQQAGRKRQAGHAEGVGHAALCGLYGAGRKAHKAGVAHSERGPRAVSANRLNGGSLLGSRSSRATCQPCASGCRACRRPWGRPWGRRRR